jgi:hypothetical protein
MATTSDAGARAVAALFGRAANGRGEERKPPHERSSFEMARKNGLHRHCRHSPETSFVVLPIARREPGAGHINE